MNILMEFNRIYVNNNPDDFRKIFELQVDGVPTHDYDIFFNDSIRYWLSYKNQTRELINKAVKVVCVYPQEVVTNLNNF